MHTEVSPNRHSKYLKDTENFHTRKTRCDATHRLDLAGGALLSSTDIISLRSRFAKLFIKYLKLISVPLCDRLESVGKLARVLCTTVISVRSAAIVFFEMHFQ